MKHQKSIVYKMMEIEKTGELSLSQEGLQMLEHVFGDKKNVYRYYNKTYTLDLFDKVEDVENMSIKTDFGILGDQVGAGKTLTIITLLSINNNIKEHDYNSYGNNHFNINVKIN